MEYKGFKIICNVHEVNPVYKTKLSDQIVSAQWGTKAKIVNQDDNFKIWHKITNAYKRIGGLTSHRLIFLAEYKYNNSGISVYVKYKSNQTVPKDVETMLKKVLCKKILEVYNVKISK